LQTADLCGMTYHQPFLTQDAGHLNAEHIQSQALLYQQWLDQIITGVLPPVINTHHAKQADFLALTSQA